MYSCAAPVFLIYYTACVFSIILLQDKLYVYSLFTSFLAFLFLHFLFTVLYFYLILRPQVKFRQCRMNKVSHFCCLYYFVLFMESMTMSCYKTPVRCQINNKSWRRGLREEWRRPSASQREGPGLNGGGTLLAFFPRRVTPHPELASCDHNDSPDEQGGSSTHWWTITEAVRMSWTICCRGNLTLLLCWIGNRIDWVEKNDLLSYVPSPALGPICVCLCCSLDGHRYFFVQFFTILMQILITF